ncbi:hypothetical protein EFL45_04245 [Weissella confusa]|uniref:hypothetical protein n=1 Tax=Weissella confusa TaxID=1583 RepID=UPI00107F2E98|nr:hypothetical protein [Weissella confusa]MBJ7629845.1 hypothetical protein [Weissella confusa]MBJ7656255.1 hypothetical protein [Weissella confusa]MCT0948650.1 hypothetical protein [Weissella confusa]TGE44146.1 hypothetical protein C6P25_04300 [Weissella confusa]
MMKARKKPIVIDVWQVRPNVVLAFYAPAWVFEAFLKGTFEYNASGNKSIVHTLEGDMTAHVGDYLAKGIDGELYPIAKDIFERTYDVIDGDE